jgi:trehalose/maltose hydrolase-like predicted phosphorylase
MFKHLNAIIICLLLAACQSSPVVTDYDTDIDFSGIHYYQWDNKTQSNDPLMSQRFIKALEKHLPLTRLEKTSNNMATHIKIKTIIKSAQRTQEPDSRGSIGLGGGGGSTLFGLSLSVPLSSETIVKDVTITIIFEDIKTKNTLWKGDYVFTVDADNPDAINQMIDKATKEILSQYPPEPEFS